jgi:hypothetical protein
LEASLKEGEGKLPLGEWAQTEPVMLDGKPFSFHRHEYLEQPYADNHPYQVQEKAAQMGCTTMAMLKVIYALRYGTPNGFEMRGAMYLMPTRTDAIDLSRSRIAPLIFDNPDSIGRWIKDTDSAGLKQIGTGFLYIRGMYSRVEIKSVPSDMNVYDELTEADPSAIDMAQERLSHSEDPHTLFLSNPTLPDYSISKLFDESDQHYWLLKCEKCNHHTCLEDTFPECLVETKNGVIRGCEKCKGELDPAVGLWVPKKPEIKHSRGYHFSQLFSAYQSPETILHQFRTTTNLRDFWNLKIGIPYIEAENRLSVEEVLALCSNDGIEGSDTGPCYMGVDQGKDLHVVIGKRHPDKAGKIVHLGIYKDWEDIDRLMRVFSVSRCVVDALPATRNARALAERQKGKIFLCYYSEHQKGTYKWNEKELTVAVNRTESLDASHNQVMKEQLILPKECDIVREFAKHLHNVAKKLEEDTESGSKRYVYVKLGEDHLRHAFNYEAIAMDFGRGSAFADLI